MRDVQLGQRAAVCKSTKSNGNHGIGNLHLHQCLAKEEGQILNLSHTIGDRHRSQGAAASEGSLSDGGHCTWNFHLHQFSTALKGFVGNPCHRARDRHKDQVFPRKTRLVPAHGALHRFWCLEDHLHLPIRVKAGLESCNHTPWNPRSWTFLTCAEVESKWSTHFCVRTFLQKTGNSLPSDRFFKSTKLPNQCCSIR